MEYSYPNCSANHLLVLCLSTSTTLSLFIRYSINLEFYIILAKISVSSDYQQ